MEKIFSFALPTSISCKFLVTLFLLPKLQKYNSQKKLPTVGKKIEVPHLGVSGELLRIEGKKCFVLLEKLGCKVSFSICQSQGYSCQSCEYSCQS